MNKIYWLPLLAILWLSGCNNLSPSDNLSPRLEQKLEKVEGNQNTLENNMNSLKAEIGRLQQTLSLQGQNNQVQQGWLNIKADGVVIGIFAATTISMLLFYMYKSSHYKRSAEALAGEIKASADDDLKERIMASVWGTKIDKTIYRLIG